MDVAGFNYRPHRYLENYKKLPQQIILGSETASTVSSRGVYKFPVTRQWMKKYDDHQSSSYDVEYCNWSNLPEDDWIWHEDKPWAIGEFVWTGFDYLGEPTPYYTDWPSHSSLFGIVDLAGLPKDRFYLYRSHWNKDAFTLHIVPHHWNFPEKAGDKIPVFVYTSADEAELFVNGRSLGRRRKDLSADASGDYYSVLSRYRLIWKDVAYEPGEIKAVAYGKGGEILGTETLYTAGPPVRVVLAPERAYGSLRVVQVTLADADGHFVPNDARRVSFAAEGCEIVAVGNSDPRGYASFKDVSSHPLCFGRAAVYVRISGRHATLRASAEGLAEAVAAFGPTERH